MRVQNISFYYNHNWSKKRTNNMCVCILKPLKLKWSLGQVLAVSDTRYSVNDNYSPLLSTHLFKEQCRSKRITHASIKINYRVGTFVFSWEESIRCNRNYSHWYRTQKLELKRVIDEHTHLPFHPPVWFFLLLASGQHWVSFKSLYVWINTYMNT